MEVKHLLLGNETLGYTYTFISPRELMITFYDGALKKKSLTVKILTHNRDSGFLSFNFEGKVFSFVIGQNQQTLLIQGDNDHLPRIVKNLHSLQLGARSVFIGEQSCQGKAIQDLLCPLSGKVIQIFIKPGDVVKTGTQLVSIESMKMENVIYASRDAIIKNVFIGVGDLVKQNQRLISFKRMGDVYGACQTTDEF